MKRKGFVLLDRDGTVIRHKHYLHRPEDVEILPGNVAAMQQLQAAGFGLVLITNQSGVGRGYYGEEDIWQVHSRLREILQREGIYLDGIYYCIHHPDQDCDCRKPATGLVEDAQRDLGLGPPNWVMVGDNRCDIELGQRIGAETVLVRTGYGLKIEHDAGVNPDYVADDLTGAARWICQKSTLARVAEAHPESVYRR